jgi:hypothetical protein
MQADEAIMFHGLERAGEIGSSSSRAFREFLKRARMGFDNRRQKSAIFVREHFGKLSVEVNHTFGSWERGFSWPRAIFIVRAFMSS